MKGGFKLIIYYLKKGLTNVSDLFDSLKFITYNDKYKNYVKIDKDDILTLIDIFIYEENGSNLLIVVNIFNMFCFESDEQIEEISKIIPKLISSLRYYFFINF